jgi:hypothetical protein
MLGVIQIIHDTWRGEGFNEMSHLLFWLFEAQFLMLLEENLFDTKQDNASKRYLLLYFKDI